MRFIAALVVVLVHVRDTVFTVYGGLTPGSRGIAASAFYAATRLGQEAVIVFFVLSGYLVGGRAIERMLNGTFQPTSYAIDRITRIWVPLVPAVLLSAAVASMGSGVKQGMSVWFGNVFALQGVAVPVLDTNHPLWSLSYEIWFYVLAYALGRQYLRKSIDIFSLVLIGAATLVFSKLMLPLLVCWLIGAWFYLKPLRMKPMIGFATSVFISMIAVAGMQFSYHSYFVPTASDSSLSMAFFEMLLAVGIGGMCSVLVMFPPTRISHLAKPMAAFSYSLYLSHYPMLEAMRARGWTQMNYLSFQSLAVFLAVASACVVLSWGLYWMFERHTARLRDALRRVAVIPSGSK